MEGKVFNINDYLMDLPPLVNDLTNDDDEMSISTSQCLDINSVDAVNVNNAEFTESRWDHQDLYSEEIHSDLQPSQIFLNRSELDKSDFDTIPTTPTYSSYNDHTRSGKLRKKRKRSKLSKVTDLSPKVFKQERNQLMMVIIKYVSIKITNLFPPSSKECKISLEKWLIIVINRLKLSLNSFLTSMIYLFRYMDIIYLLRYLNQSNNFANFNEMDYPLRELIVGCFKLTLMKEKVHKNWPHLVGLSNNEVNSIIKTILKRLNNKLIIKDNELQKFKNEIFRYVKMISSQRT